MNNMKIKFDTRRCPNWFGNFVQAELWDEYKLRLKQHKEQLGSKEPNWQLELLNRAVEFYTKKGLTAWYEEDAEDQYICFEIDLDSPEWTMAMLKYEGATC